MYIDENYYANEYMGKEVSGDIPLSSYIRRACDTIDQLTNDSIGDLSTHPEFVQDKVKKAVAAQTEFLIMNGLYSGNDTMPTNISVGIFNYSGSQNATISPDVIPFLRRTGLMYAGLHVRREGLPMRWYW